jgi:glycosyltransferase involved in cell wall biosynthesis
MVVHSHYPLGEPRVEREARAAVEAGYTVHVVCLGARDEAASEAIDGVEIVRLPVEHARGVGGARLVYEYLAFAFLASIAVIKINRRARIDIAYVHAPPDFLVAAALVPRLLGSRLVLDIHDLSPHMFDVRFGGGPFGSVVQRLLRLVEVGACALADRVVSVREQYRDELVAHGIARSKTIVVMNSPDATVIGGVECTSRGTTPFTVAYHGTVTHWYGVDLVVAAIAELDGRIADLRAVVIGEGDALAEAERLAHERGVDDRIEFSRRYLPQAEALRRIACASCGVIPNRPSRLNRFALSSKLLEYVALGIPVVVSRLETLAAHFDADEVTFFEPGDAGSLAEAIAWVAKNPDEASTRAQRALVRAQAYSWTESRARLLEVLSDLS